MKPMRARIVSIEFIGGGANGVWANVRFKAYGAGLPSLLDTMTMQVSRDAGMMLLDDHKAGKEFDIVVDYAPKDVLEDV